MTRRHPHEGLARRSRRPEMHWYRSRRPPHRRCSDRHHRTRNRANPRRPAKFREEKPARHDHHRKPEEQSPQARMARQTKPKKSAEKTHLNVSGIQARATRSRCGRRRITRRRADASGNTRQRITIGRLTRHSLGTPNKSTLGQNARPCIDVPRRFTRPRRVNPNGMARSGTTNVDVNEFAVRIKAATHVIEPATNLEDLRVGYPVNLNVDRSSRRMKAVVTRARNQRARTITAVHINRAPRKRVGDALKCPQKPRMSQTHVRYPFPMRRRFRIGFVR